MKNKTTQCSFVGWGHHPCANHEHFHVYLTYKRQTGNVVTRQTFDRAPHLTRPPTAHISRGGYVILLWIEVARLLTAVRFDHITHDLLWIKKIIGNSSIQPHSQLTIYGCNNVSTTLNESCENIIQESYVSVATTLSGNFERKWGKCSLSTQRLASFLIHLCLSCFFGYNLLPIAHFLRLTKTYQFMWVYNSDINKRYIWEFRPVKVILNIVWHWKWAT